MSNIDEIQLSEEQQNAIDNIIDWFNNKSDIHQIFTLVGYAGSGKSTIISFLNNLLPNISIAYASFTGKATSVLNKKLEQLQVYPDYVGTIHSMIYYPQKDDKDNIIFILKSKYNLDYDLIIIDESSMINDDLFADLLSFNIPILFVGDNGQLPPVKGSSIIHLDEPDFELTEIHRQAINNPILKLSYDIRLSKNVSYGKYSDNVFIINFKDSKYKHFANNIISDYDINDSIIICGWNNTRCILNSNIKKIMFERNIVKDEHKVSIGDKVICLKNNKKVGIFNGMIGIVTKINYNPYNHNDFKDIYKLTINFNGNKINCLVNAKQFLSRKTLTNDNYELQKRLKITIELFDLGYAITCHKSQGSEFKNVIIVRELNSKLWDQKRWDYTAVTRATDSVCIICK